MLLKKANISIDQDWSKIRKMYDIMLNAVKDGKCDAHKVWVDEWLANRYDFGDRGSLILNQHLSPDWGIWTGPLLESLMPWFAQAKAYFKPLNFSHITWSVTFEDTQRHFDTKIESEKDKVQTNINYVVRSDDPDAYTFMESRDDPSITDTYKSVPGQAFLMDPSQYHTVINKAHREVIQFKFFNTFQEISDFLDTAPAVVFK